ncbi:MAG: hypothetical protein JWN07_1226 [Hyphomicrobiales bacterium]|nr:hypothetical protein [Hyphomicrobiales bacterium]
MMMLLRAAALAAAFVIPLSSVATLAAGDAFAEACVARGKASVSHCACESKLARASLKAGEQAAMIRAMKGDTEGFRTAIAAMGTAPAQAFVGKMKKLQARSDAECR